MLANPLISAFNSGEVDPKLFGRVDLDWYDNACAELQNVVCLPGGAADRRPGSRFVVAAKTETAPVALLAFEFSSTPALSQAYVIEAGDLYFRFNKNKAQLLDGATPVEVTTTYLAADLAGIKTTQKFDVLYLFHPEYFARKLSRTSEIAWTISVIDFIDGPYFTENPDDALLLALSGGAPWTKGSTLTLTATGGHTPFDTLHIGAIWRLTSGSDFAWVKVTAFTSSTVVTVEAKVDVPVSLQGAAVNSWREGLYSDFRGHPSCASFHNERLCLAGAGGEPWRGDASATGLYETFTPGTADGDAISFTLATGKANAIFWLLSADQLLAGTSGGVHRIGPDGEGAVWTPKNTPARKIEASAAADVSPVAAITEGLFVARHKRRVRALGFQVLEDKLVARDATLRAGHIGATGIAALAWQEQPHQVCWALRIDGVMAALTFMPDQKVEGWHRHIIGGAFGGGAAVIESIAVIPGANQDELWIVAKRTIDGATRRYIEVLEDFRTEESLQVDAFFVDSGAVFSGAPATVITGLGHLEGETVQIYADGGPVADQIVVGGQVTLTDAASTVAVGLGYIPRIVPLSIEAGAARGTAAGRLKRIASLALRLWKSGSVRFGPDDANLDDMQLNPGQLLGAPPDLFTGVTDHVPASDWDRQGPVVITQNKPVPLTVLALMPEMEASE